MFNAPRPTHANYSGFGGSFVDESANPLAASAYDDGLDPWSGNPSPAPPPVGPVFASTVSEASVPGVYQAAFSAVDPAGSGECSVNALSRVLATSGLPASTVERIVNLVSSRPRVSKMEFHVALALVALAQDGHDLSVEQVHLLAQQNALPEPKLDLAAISAPSTLPAYPKPPKQHTYSSDDPWGTAAFSGPTPATNGTSAEASTTGGASMVAGSGLPKNWWTKQEKVTVNFAGQQGFLLNRYMLYELVTERGAPVTRRYSEFVFLWDCLVRRYPFRLLPQLPPKRIGPDESFLEQRRKGLQRFLNFVINHPVIKMDALLATFLAEPSFEQWRKHTTISLEEESTGKRVDRVEEMTIPSDLEDKLASVRAKIVPLIQSWQNMSVLSERIVRKREAAAVRPLSTTRPPPFPHTGLSASLTGSFYPTSTSSTTTANNDDASSVRSLSTSIKSLFTTTTNSTTNGTNAKSTGSDMQADLARLTNTLRALPEVQGTCWRGEDCELSEGVKQGVRRFATHAQAHTDMLEQRTQVLLNTTIEAVKSQRDLYLAMRDLFVRHDRLSVDQVERLKKRIDTTSVKLDGIKASAKDGWEEEADRLTSLIEKDKAGIQQGLARRVFIRACMWHELRVVLHNRENTLLTQAAQGFAREEAAYADGVAHNWNSLVEALEGMPYE